MPETKPKRATPIRRASPKEKMERRQILLPDDLYLPCAELGAKSNVSASAIVRYAIADYLARRGVAKK